jgi:phytanoyl-CoA hydroxylase
MTPGDHGCGTQAPVLDGGASALIQAYDRDGYVISRDAIDAELIAEARDHVEWLIKRNPERRPEHLGQPLWRGDPFWYRLVSDPRLLRIASEFIGTDIALMGTHYIAKPPVTGQPVLWHQDGSYWPLDPMRVVTLWLAVDDADAGNGCMRVIPGSHQRQLHPMLARTDVANVLGSGMDASLVDETQARDVCLRAGDVSIHHPNLIHGSNANTSVRWRRGLTIRYIPTTTRLTDGREIYLLQGPAVPGINTYLPRPRYCAGTHMAFSSCERWNPAP